MKTINFVPIHAYAKKYGTSRQNVYRWIRERKIPEDKIKRIEKIVVRICVDENFEILKK